MKMAAIALLAAITQQAPTTEFAWDCRVSIQRACGPAGCSTIKPTTSLYLYPSANFYWRCPIGWKDLAVSDEYKTTVSVSGAYRNFELPVHTAFARVGPGLAFVEVVTSMDRVFVSHGACTVGPPPLVRPVPDN